MKVGSVEYVVIGFPGNQFKGEIAPAIKEIIDRDIVRILDLVFVMRDEAGETQAVEVAELPEESRGHLSGWDHKVSGLLSEDDIRSIAAALDPNTSALLIAWENKWQARLADAIRNLGGVLVAHEKVTADAVQEALAYAESQGVTV